jgi:DNA-binding SARP family transcriptional activator/tetratricopeptide (TPR) repeat protein
MDFRVLGPVEIRQDERCEVLAGRLQRTLLGVLLARANQPVPVDTLTGALWGDQPDTRSGQKLQLHVHRLRGALGAPDRLTFGPAGYRLRVLPGELDAERFEAGIEAGRRLAGADPQRAVDSLRGTLRLWGGVPFGDTDVPELQDWARRLSELRLTGLETLFQAELACGLNTAVAGELASLVREHPLRERLHGLLMTALYRAGRTAEALAAYRTARETLVTELGLEPGPELRELERRILAGEPVPPLPPAADAAGADAPGTDGAPEEQEEQEEQQTPPVPAQLPLDVGTFTGRTAELAELDGLPAADPAPAIAVLAGTAGVGKTALAVHWARRVRDRFPDGQLYVDLCGYGPDQPVSADDALGGFLRALGLGTATIPQDLAERAARFRTLVDRRRMLIVLDNARTADQVRPLLPGSPSCFTLVTSRDTLAGLVAREGAHRIGLERLPLPDARALLHRLLGDRVTAEPKAADALAERCARLPLALRIAAELARSQPTRDIAGLAGELAGQQDALDLLDIDGDPQTAVRAVFSWSYRRLDPAVARVFRLGGLHPGHDMDDYALAALAGEEPRETRRALQVLLRAHLIDRLPGGRYRPHDLLRAYAAGLAATTDAPAERAEALDRLLAYYGRTASAAMDVVAAHETAGRPKPPVWDGQTPSFTAHDQALRWLDAERGNLLEASQHGGPASVIGLSETLWRYLDTAGYHEEARTLHSRALRAAQAAGDRLAEANARRMLSTAINRMGTDAEAAISHLERALAVYQEIGDPALEAAAIINLGNVYGALGELDEAVVQFKRVLTLNGPDGDWQLRRAATTNIGSTLLQLGRYQEALPYLRDALEVCHSHRDTANEANALAGIAECQLGLERDTEALDHAGRGLALARDTAYRLVESSCLRVLGVLRRKAGDYRQALRLHHEALALARGGADTELLVKSLNALAASHAAAGHPAEARRLLAEAQAVEEEAGGLRLVGAESVIGRAASAASRPGSG